MARLLVYYAHPGHRFSGVNKPMAAAAAALEGIGFVDLYAEYPRHNIDIAREQERLGEADIILFQCPFFWYSTPSIVKEWQDLVLEHGFAYGDGGDKLAGKALMFALTAAGPETAYRPQGYQHYRLREFTRPLEQTARLCQMRFLAPYVLYGALKAPSDGRASAHLAGYRRLLVSLRDDRYDLDRAEASEVVTAETLPIDETAREIPADG